MDFLKQYEKPDVSAPVFLFAFAGWADAAESATHALRYLVKRVGAHEFALFDIRETNRLVEQDLAATGEQHDCTRHPSLFHKLSHSGRDALKTAAIHLRRCPDRYGNEAR